MTACIRRNRLLWLLVSASVLTPAVRAAPPMQDNRVATSHPGPTHRGTMASRAKFSLLQARAIALKAHPGTITDEELETERGGSGLRYSFDIKDALGTHEVGVDAITGAVLENKLEGPHAD